MIQVLEGSGAGCGCSSSTLCHNARQLSARQERKRFRVSFTPFGEMATVNGSPSISISRRISFRSLVAIWFYTPALGERLPSSSDSRHVSRRSFSAGRENILGVPFTPVLPKGGITDETGYNQHHVSGL